MICPRCGTRLPDAASECSSCSMPTSFMGDDGRVVTTGEVLEPEVLESLEEVDTAGFGGSRNQQPHVRPLGCAVGPGCGCIGLPLLVLAGVFVSAAIALLWVLSLGRLPASLLELAARARRGFTRT